MNIGDTVYHIEDGELCGEVWDILPSPDPKNPDQVLVLTDDRILYQEDEYDWSDKPSTLL